ncbi:hypothetical protein B296_00005094 [Ensete ventricosum]|uniref:Uncharacterized protein n=1 Tax=Ensete ventricosum TaxID=4639 RepID=A0A427AZH6_ENSVE|nr:hypothetical protein B296_00005094 [Ensete ventricosum]
MTETWLEAASLSSTPEGMTHFMCLLRCLHTSFVFDGLTYFAGINLLGMKKVVLAQAPHLEMSAPTPKPMPAPGEGSSQKEKGVARPRSIRDLCWAWVPDEPCIAREIHHHFAMGLIDQVRDFGRVIDNISRLNEELWANVQKLKEEFMSVVIVAVEARANEAIMKLEGVQRGEAKALEKVKALEKEIHGLKADLKAAEMKN